MLNTVSSPTLWRAYNQIFGRCAQTALYRAYLVGMGAHALAHAEARHIAQRRPSLLLPITGHGRASW
jgi:hypothetical protein